MPSSDCSECNYYMKHLDFGHDKCQEHRACHTREGYEPHRCDACLVNRGVWVPISSTSGVNTLNWKYPKLEMHFRILLCCFNTAFGIGMLIHTYLLYLIELLVLYLHICYNNNTDSFIFVT